jgi:chemotaxis protein methyltransferase CheR
MPALSLAPELQGLPMSQAEFRAFSALVLRSCGIRMEGLKFDLLRTRLAKRVRALKLSSFKEYYEWVCSEPSGEELERMIDVVTTHKTEFFRESGHYQELIRRLRERGQARDPQLPWRLWSAACSTGEEPYSMAMALLEGLGAGTPFKILATDISSGVVAAATRGLYTAERTSSLPLGYRDRYFQRLHPKGEATYSVGEALRETVQFSRFNLNDPDDYVFTRKFDAIFCRNVMIYFDRPTQETLVQRLSALLAPEGLLFTGFSESLIGIKQDLKTLSPSVYQKAARWETRP